MRELALESRKCNVCGARVEGACARGMSNVSTFSDKRIARAPRARSGLAYAAGFAGVIYLFHYPFVAFGFRRLGVASALGSFFAVDLSFFAPAAVALAFAAGVSLDRSREKSGALPALFGLFVGLLGTFDLLVMYEPLLRYLLAF
jgi:hypothetical protein